MDADIFMACMRPLEAYVEKHPLAVAVSGGSDSMALTLLAQEWTKACGQTLTALTVDHGLREEAAAEAETVHRWLTERNITHHILTHKNIPPEHVTQEYARDLRYGLLREWCTAHDAPALLLAHQLEDQVETFVMHLERGSGVDGLSAMPVVAEQQGLLLLRPLLSVSRTALRAYLEGQKQTWIEDPTNVDTRYTRNRMRQLLALHDHDDAVITKRLFETARHMGRARHALEVTVNAFLKAHVRLQDKEAAFISLTGLREAEEEIGLRAVAALLMHIGEGTEKPRFAKLHALYSALVGGVVEKPRTLHHCSVFIAEDSVVICTEGREKKALSADDAVPIVDATNPLLTKPFIYCTQPSYGL